MKDTAIKAALTTIVLLADDLSLSHAERLAKIKEQAERTLKLLEE